MANPKAGLLPLYLELYDNTHASARLRMDEFAETIANELRNRDIDVTLAPVCRLEPEFNSAVANMEEAGVDAIVTLHLAYSPSLECINALSETRLPIIVLDTTPTYAYGPDQDPDELMFNHGIHGVQDMCNMLIRRDKPFFIETGHWEKSDVLDRTAEWLKAARLASNMRQSKTGLIGDPFKGMGDFSVPFDILKSTIGIEILKTTPDEISALMPDANDIAVKNEIDSDLKSFSTCEINEEAHINTARTSIAVRRWIGKNKLNAFTMNFGSFSGNESMPTIPFLEASKSMAKGIGYAGEGDVLTASLVGALASVWQETTFTEMFCPDWENETIYLSHMGEFNPELTADKAELATKDLQWLNTGSMVMAVGRLKPGFAAIVNLAPGPDDLYTLIIAPIEMLDVEVEDRMTNSVRGWFRPPTPISEFLTTYSYLGGTHHSALVYGAEESLLAKFGEIMGWNVAIIE